MLLVNWLVVNRNGVRGVRKTKPSLEYDEVAIKLNINVPKELFERPSLEATITVDALPDNSFSPQVVIDTVDLIEQQTGAKISFQVVQPTDIPNQNNIRANE